MVFGQRLISCCELLQFPTLFFCLTFSSTLLVKYEYSFSATSLRLVIILFPVCNSNLRSFKTTVVGVVKTVFAVI